jgi:hypothetical protein
VEIPEEKSLRRQITCIVLPSSLFCVLACCIFSTCSAVFFQVRDANQGAEKFMESLGVKMKNTLLGRCDIPVDGITSKIQSPKWYLFCFKFDQVLGITAIS